MHLSGSEANKSLRINVRTAETAKSEAKPNPTEAKSQRSKSCRIRARLNDKPN